MKNEEIVRDKLMEELENNDWDISDEGLEEVATRLKSYFDNQNEALEFVEENASYLFKTMMDEFEG
jgi:hypothetical protein